MNAEIREQRGARGQQCEPPIIAVPCGVHRLEQTVIDLRRELVIKPQLCRGGELRDGIAIQQGYAHCLGKTSRTWSLVCAGYNSPINRQGGLEASRPDKPLCSLRLHLVLCVQNQAATCQRRRPLIKPKINIRNVFIVEAEWYATNREVSCLPEVCL